MAQAALHHSKVLVEAGTNELEIITFYLRWQNPGTNKIVTTAYGINAAKVKELVAVPAEITEVPDRRAECVKGVFLLRDKTIILTDLCHWFGYQADLSPEARGTWVVVVAEINGKPFGFITHGVDKVYRMGWDKIQSPPEILGADQSITGVCLVDNHLIQMVDFEKIAAAIDPAMAMVPAIEEGIIAAADHDKVVVIAEDSTTLLAQIRRTLESAGLKVVPHHDGQAAWDYLERVKEQGSVDDQILAVITDIEMPRMDGHHLCRRIKEEPAFKKVPVLLFSSMIGNGLRAKGLAVGADDQVTKPELANLVNRLRACLDKKAEG
jgi:two-component system, chemotaxis family, chemotaxis protein CheV